MELFILRNLILQTCMHSHAMGLDVWFLVGPFVCFHTSWKRTAKALARLRECIGSPESSLVDCMISTIISWAGSFCILLYDISSLTLPCIMGHQRYFKSLAPLEILREARFKNILYMIPTFAILFSISSSWKFSFMHYFSNQLHLFLQNANICHALTWRNIFWLCTRVFLFHSFR